MWVLLILDRNGRRIGAIQCEGQFEPNDERKHELKMKFSGVGGMSEEAAKTWLTETMYLHTEQAIDKLWEPIVVPNRSIG
jgi:hypothetical protein